MAHSRSLSRCKCKRYILIAECIYVCARYLNSLEDIVDITQEAGAAAKFYTPTLLVYRYDQRVLSDPGKQMLKMCYIYIIHCLHT